MSSAITLSFPLDPAAFQSHRYTTNGVQHLYHVYDDLSQTPYRAGEGIQSGDINLYLMHPQYIITYNAMSKHLDWKNREPTYFISLYGDRQAAIDEADRRRNQVVVPDQVMPRNPASVRIAEISVQALDGSDVFYFSRNELFEMLQPPVTNDVFVRSRPGEWFVMAYIPDDAVTRII